MAELLQVDPDAVLVTSAKSGLGCDRVLPEVVRRVPPPTLRAADPAAAAVARVVDSWFDEHRGVILLVKVEAGVLREGARVATSTDALGGGGDAAGAKAAAAQPGYSVQEIGVLCPGHVRTGALRAGQVGCVKEGASAPAAAAAAATTPAFAATTSRHYPILHYYYRYCHCCYYYSTFRSPLLSSPLRYAITGMRSAAQAPLGDALVLWPVPAGTGGLAARGAIDDAAARAEEREAAGAAGSMLFASMYPVDTGAFDQLALAVEKLTLNDASVSVTREHSPGLGMGLRCGFLGLLHMSVFQQRLDEEFGVEAIVTAPCVLGRAVSLAWVALVPSFHPLTPPPTPP